MSDEERYYGGGEHEDYGGDGDFDGEDFGGEDFVEEDSPVFEGSPKFAAEFKAFERVGVSNITQTYLVASLTTSGDDVLNKLFLQDPKVKFIMRLDRAYNTISEEILPKKYKLAEGDLGNMLAHMKNVKDIGQKNPQSYLLAYIATKNGTVNPSSEEIEYIVENLLPAFDGMLDYDSSSVKPTDIIRYVRLWLGKY